MAKFNRFVPYHEESVRKALELCKNCKTLKEKYSVITKYVSHNFYYDFIKALKVPKKGVLPDIPGCWNNKCGICQDIAAMTAGMLRAVGLESYLVIGHADKYYHAWVETTIGGKLYRYDRSGKAKVYTRERVY